MRISDWSSDVCSSDLYCFLYRFALYTETAQRGLDGLCLCLRFPRLPRSVPNTRLHLRRLRTELGTFLLDLGHLLHDLGEFVTGKLFERRRLLELLTEHL